MTDTSTATAPDIALQRSALDRRYDSATRRVRATPGGQLVLKAVVFVVGLVVVAGGVALAVLPGPLTIPPVLVGVYVWSLEFGWARRLRARANRQAQEAWASAKEHPARATAITVGGLVVAGLVVWAVVHYDLVARVTGAVG